MASSLSVEWAAIVKVALGVGASSAHWRSEKTPQARLDRLGEWMGAVGQAAAAASGSPEATWMIVGDQAPRAAAADDAIALRDRTHAAMADGERRLDTEAKKDLILAMVEFVETQHERAALISGLCGEASLSPSHRRAAGAPVVDQEPKRSDDGWTTWARQQRQEAKDRRSEDDRRSSRVKAYLGQCATEWSVLIERSKEPKARHAMLALSTSIARIETQRRELRTRNANGHGGPAELMAAEALAELGQLAIESFAQGDAAGMELADLALSTLEAEAAMDPRAAGIARMAMRPWLGAALGGSQGAASRALRLAATGTWAPLPLLDASWEAENKAIEPRGLAYGLAFALGSEPNRQENRHLWQLRAGFDFDEALAAGTGTVGAATAASGRLATVALDVAEGAALTTRSLDLLDSALSTLARKATMDGGLWTRKALARGAEGLERIGESLATRGHWDRWDALAELAARHRGALETLSGWTPKLDRGDLARKGTTMAAKLVMMIGHLRASAQGTHSTVATQAADDLSAAADAILARVEAWELARSTPDAPEGRSARI